MKVIGHTDYSYIVQVDRSEFSRITGVAEHLAYQHGLCDGTEIKVAPIWQRLKDVLALKEKLNQLAVQFRGLAEIAANVDAVIPEAAPAAPKQEGAE